MENYLFLPLKLDELPKNTEKTFALFRESSDLSLDFRNEFFDNKIRSIKKQRRDFRLVTTDTANHCDNLIDLGGKINMFIMSSIDETISDEEILQRLKLLLQYAKKIKTAIKNTRTENKTIGENVIKNHDELLNFIAEGATIDPEIYNNLKKAEFLNPYLKVVPIVFVIVILFTIVLFSEAKTSTTALSVILGILGILGIIMVGFGNENNANIERLKETLNQRKKQIDNKLKVLENNADSMSITLRNLEVFWIDHVAGLENFIDSLQSTNEENIRPDNQSYVEIVTNQWTETIKEYERISHFMRDEVDKDLRILSG